MRASRTRRLWRQAVQSAPVLERLSGMSRERLKGINVPFWITLFVIILGWEFFARVVVENSLVIVPLGRITERGLEMWTSGQLWIDIQVSGLEVALGFLVGAVFGVSLGLLTGNWRVAGRAADPIVSALFAMPIIALAPLFIITLGIGIASKVVIVALAVFFPVILNTAAGVRATDVSYRELGKVFHLNEFSILWKIVIPSSIPFILSGFRIATGRALTTVIAAELFGARDGLGLRILTSARAFDVAGVYVGVLIFAAAGVMLTKAFYLLEARVERWRV